MYQKRNINTLLMRDKAVLLFIITVAKRGHEVGLCETAQCAYCDSDERKDKFFHLLFGFYGLILSFLHSLMGKPALTFGQKESAGSHHTRIRFGTYLLTTMGSLRLRRKPLVVNHCPFTFPRFQFDARLSK